MALLFPVKTEAPELGAGGGAPYALAFPSSHGATLFRFGLARSPPLDSPWPRSATPPPPVPVMSYSDEYDDPAPPPDRIVRRRSSKACDQCRKSKCKCERAAPSEPCKNCVMLNTRASPPSLFPQSPPHSPPTRHTLTPPTACTFLGPSRKRGPPKGYIDAIEARLHQTEALLGILLATRDPRARALLDTAARDPLARDIIARVDNSPYGVLGRRRAGPSAAGNAAPAGPSAPNPNPTSNPGVGRPRSATSSASPDAAGELAAAHPSNEWQDRVAALLDAAAAAAHLLSPSPTPSPSSLSHADDDDRMDVRREHTHEDSDSDAPLRRTRRRLRAPSPSRSSLHTTHARARSPVALAVQIPAADATIATRDGIPTADSDGGGADGAAGALGQLSLNEDAQVRFHGTASGLYLLDGIGRGGRRAGRNEGGIWRFPKARVWPPVAPPSPPPAALALAPARALSASASSSGPSSASTSASALTSALTSAGAAPGGGATLGALGERTDTLGPTPGALPPRSVQKRLLRLYFRHVQPAFPIVHKAAFMEGYRSAPPGAPGAPPILLLAMFALAARYAGAPPPPPLPVPANASNTSNTSSSNPTTNNNPPNTSNTSNTPNTPPTPPPAPPTMWPAGDEFLDGARALLDRDGAYAAARPATVQALLLLGHRELGIGAMAAAWTYVGLAIRMAQDLGMHRAAEGWARGGAGLRSSSGSSSRGEAEGEGGVEGGRDGGGGDNAGRLFGAAELSERRRIWWGCVIMDKYVSTYIGRPLMVFAWDFDTGLPDEREAEETEALWVGGALDDDAYGVGDDGVDARGDGGGIGGKGMEVDNMEVDGDVDMDACVGDPAGALHAPARVLSCFNASARLAGILGIVVQTLYAVRPLSSRAREAAALEGLLAQWLIALPEHLRVAPSATAAAASSSSSASSGATPTAKTPTATGGKRDSAHVDGDADADAPRPASAGSARSARSVGSARSAGSARGAEKKTPPLPHVLTLHMQYWCAVLLLHRPFIGAHVAAARAREAGADKSVDVGKSKSKSAAGAGKSAQEDEKDGGKDKDKDTEEADAAEAARCFGLCNAAATHISSLVALYQEHHALARCSVFLCYYVFSAGVMHDTNLSVHPADPQAQLGLARCLNALRAMSVVWPSAARAIELFGGAPTVAAADSAAGALVKLATRRGAGALSGERGEGARRDGGRDGSREGAGREGAGSEGGREARERGKRPAEGALDDRTVGYGALRGYEYRAQGLAQEYRLPEYRAAEYRAQEYRVEQQQHQQQMQHQQQHQQIQMHDVHAHQPSQHAQGQQQQYHLQQHYQHQQHHQQQQQQQHQHQHQQHPHQQHQQHHLLHQHQHQHAREPHGAFAPSPASASAYADPALFLAPLPAGGYAAAWDVPAPAPFAAHGSPPAPASTAVLPQLYSTGLDLADALHAPPRSGGGSVSASGNGGNGGAGSGAGAARFAPYGEIAYGGGYAAYAQHAAGAEEGDAPAQLYLAEQYGLYGMPSSLFSLYPV
ncbi:hypothetical protein HYPSUDRAFT_199780 [Hypholoma sublateritium FD-334 SS-4]|uniref:Zn(2)-C6 fungal-type domain-containing protein n=1 Tax=Hypholoma sublateritium (strain FD-334 SS-4) TaxID=945553 RepID=A0A0D2P9J4_HYPSF|nr:hypothetical protein HYPSUDRAFT_199780 [Hypholoma sublateritium FD-334 SS-4]